MYSIVWMVEGLVPRTEAALNKKEKLAKVMMFITGTEAMEQSYDVYYRDRSNGTKL